MTFPVRITYKKTKGGQAFMKSCNVFAKITNKIIRYCLCVKILARKRLLFIQAMPSGYENVFKCPAVAHYL